MTDDRTCPRCGATRRHDSRFCSRACYWADRRENTPPCGVEGCDSPRRGLGLCDKHYQRLRAYGRTHSRRDLSIEDRFWSFVSIGEPDDCWEWQGSRHDFGYGHFNLQNTPRVRVLAHRFAYELATGVNVDSHVVMHACDNPPCCNPGHLSRGTQSENALDMHAKGRANLSGLEIGWELRRRGGAA